VSFQMNVIELAITHLLKSSFTAGVVHRLSVSGIVAVWTMEGE